MPEELVEAKVAEAAHAQAVATEAHANARSAQTREDLYSVFKEILTEGDEGTKKLLIQKIPLLCTDIMSLKAAIDDIKSAIERNNADMRWLKWIGTGFVGVGGLLALKQLGL